MKIKSEYNKIGSQYFTLEVHYNAKIQAFFLKGLPEDFKTYSELWRNCEFFSSENVLWSALSNAKDEYVKNKQSERKVIVLLAKASTRIIMNEAGEGNIGYVGYKNPKFKKLSDHQGGDLDYEVGFEFSIMTEIDNAGKKSYYNHKVTSEYKETGKKDEYPRTIKERSTILPYSDETLAFLVQLSKGFETMVQKMAMFFGEEDENKTLEYIKHNRYLIGAPDAEKI